MQAKEPDLDERSSELAQLATRIARRLGLSSEMVDEIARAAELHDVGKVGVAHAIVNKPAALDTDEREWDGTGYPDGIRGEQIPLGARVVAVCDAYEAMTTNRPYSSARARDSAIRQLRANAGSQFDPYSRRRRRGSEPFIRAHAQLVHAAYCAPDRGPRK